LKNYWFNYGENQVLIEDMFGIGIYRITSEIESKH